MFYLFVKITFQVMRLDHITSSFIFVFIGNLTVLLRNCTHAIHITHTPQCSDDMSPLRTFVKGLGIYSKTNHKAVQIVKLTGKWCACSRNRCNGQAIRAFEDSLRFPSQSTLPPVVTTTEEVDASTTQTMINNVTTDVKSWSPNILFNNKLFAFVIVALYLSPTG